MVVLVAVLSVLAVFVPPLLVYESWRDKDGGGAGLIFGASLLIAEFAILGDGAVYAWQWLTR